MTWKPDSAVLIEKAPAGPAWKPPSAKPIDAGWHSRVDPAYAPPGWFDETDPVAEAGRQSDDAWKLVGTKGVDLASAEAAVSAQRHKERYDPLGYPLSPVRAVRYGKILDELYTREAYKEAATLRQDEKRAAGAHGYWLEALDSVARGVANVSSGFKQALASLNSMPKPPGAWYIETEGMAAARAARAERYRQEAELFWNVARHPELAARNDNLVLKGINIIGETLPYIAATTAAYTLTGPLGGFAVGGLIEGNSAYREALDAGVDAQTAKYIGIGVGVVNGVIESIGGKLAEEFFERVIKAKVANRIAQAGGLFAVGTLVEALEEGTQELSKIVGEEVYRDVDWAERVNRILGSMAAGAFLGSTMRGTQIAAHKLVGEIVERPSMEDELTKAIRETVGLDEATARQIAQEAIRDKFYPDEPTTGTPQRRSLSGIVEDLTRDLPLLSEEEMQTAFGGETVRLEDIERLPQEAKINDDARRKLEEVFNKPVETSPAAVPAEGAAPVAAEAPAAAETRQSWEMSLLDYGKGQLPESQRGQITDPRQVKSFSAQHINDIKAALERGEMVPEGVLREYRGTAWADEALAKLDKTTGTAAEPSRVAPSQPGETAQHIGEMTKDEVRLRLKALSRKVSEGEVRTEEVSLKTRMAQIVLEEQRPEFARMPLATEVEAAKLTVPGAIRLIPMPGEAGGGVRIAAPSARTPGAWQVSSISVDTVSEQVMPFRHVEFETQEGALQYLRNLHRQQIESAAKTGQLVPRRVLEDYQGQAWADEALAKLEAETPPTASIGAAAAGFVGQDEAENIRIEAQQLADEQYRKMRKTELANTTKAIRSHPIYQAEVEGRKEAAFNATGLGTVYFPPEYRGDLEAYAGEKGKKGSNKKLWAQITFDKNAGQHWDDAAAELGWPDDFDGFMERFVAYVEGDIAPDDLHVAQGSGEPELETLALKKAMLQAGAPVAAINAEIEANLTPQNYPGLSQEDAEVLAAQLKIGGQQWETSVGSAAYNWMSRRRAIDRANKQARKTGTPRYVVQQQGGRFLVKDAPPKRGHYTLVDMSRPLIDQVVFIKQASPTVEEAFDYGEHPKESLHHLSELERFKAKLKEKTAEAQAIADEIWQYIKTNVPTEQQGRFIPLLRRVTPKRATKTNLNDLLSAIARTEELLRGNDRRQAIADFKKAWKAAKAKAKRREMDAATRAKLDEMIGDIDLAKLSEGKQMDLASLGRYLNRLAQRLAQGDLSEAETREAVLSIPKGRLEALQRLGRTQLAEMTTEDIRALAGELTRFVHQAELKQRLAGERKARQRRAVLQESIEEVAAVGDINETETRILRHGWWRNFFTTKSAHLDTLIERITRPGPTTSRQILVHDIWEGWSVRAGVRRDAARMMKRGIHDIGFSGAEFDAMDHDVEVVIGGHSRTITRWELLSLYMHSKDDSSVQEILKTVALRFQERKIPTFKSYVEMSEALDALTEKERAVGDLFTRINQEVLAPAINAASMELEGRELADNPYYWRRGRVFPKAVAGRIADIAIEDTGPFQPRTGGTVPIDIVPFQEAIAEAIDAASTYAGMAVPLYNARSIVNTSEWQDAIQEAGYADEMDALFTLYRRMQSYGSEQAVVDSMGKRRLTRFAASRLSLRISSLVGQYAGIPAAATEIPAKYFVGVRPSRKRLERAMALRPVLEARWGLHHLNVEAGNAALLAGHKGLFFGSQPLLDKPLNLLSRADGQVGSIMAGAIENQLKAERPDLQPGTDAFDMEVAQRLEYAIRRTQGSFEIVDRSVLLSDTTLAARTVMMFHTAMEAQWNIALRAGNRYQKSQHTAADAAVLGADMGLVLTGAFVETGLKWSLRWALLTGAAATLAALGLLSGDDEPEDERRQRDLLAQLALRSGENVISIVPGGNWLGGMLTASYKAITGARQRPSEPLPGALEALRDNTITLLPDAVNLGRHLATGETYASGPNRGKPKWQTEAVRVFDKTADVVSMYTGAPYSGPASEWRRTVGLALDAARVQRLTNKELREEIRLNTYGPSAKKHTPGTAHMGRENYVNLLRTELKKRQRRTP